MIFKPKLIFQYYNTAFFSYQTYALFTPDNFKSLKLFESTDLLNSKLFFGRFSYYDVLLSY